MIPNIFDPAISQEMIERLEKLSPESQGLWGKMSVDQMLAHCCVSYEMVFESGKHPRPGAIMRMLLKAMVKKKVVGDTPYSQNGPTGPAFLIKGNKDFQAEKERLIGYIRRSQELGADYFEGKESLSFGKLKSGEWNNMFYKHLDHHLRQFGV